jgi:outer membrane protein assembly factor BamD
MGFIDYIALDYDAAIIKFTKLIKKYPSLKNIDYVYYMKALCFYEQISHEGLDGEYNILALENLDQVVKRFPESQYSKDSYQKIILVKSNIAAKHMTIARFYQKNNKYTAALNRYKVVVDDFSETKFTPEALYRISEIYYSIGMIDESTKIAAILGHNYPESQWYQYSYNNLTKKQEGSIFSNSINKIFK